MESIPHTPEPPRLFRWLSQEKASGTLIRGGQKSEESRILSPLVMATMFPKHWVTNWCQSIHIQAANGTISQQGYTCNCLSHLYASQPSPLKYCAPVLFPLSSFRWRSCCSVHTSWSSWVCMSLLFLAIPFHLCSPILTGLSFSWSCW